MIYYADDINLALLQNLFIGTYDLIVLKNADESILSNLSNVKDILITDKHEDESPKLGIHASHDLPWHIDRILEDPVFCINNLFCRKFDDDASPTLFSFMRRKIIDKHRDIKVTYSLHNLTGLDVKEDLKDKIKTYNLVQEDSAGEYYFYTSKIGNKNYDFLFEDENYIYVHNWEVGDLVLWNNYTVAHKRNKSPNYSREFVKRFFLNENQIFGYRSLK